LKYIAFLILFTSLNAFGGVFAGYSEGFHLMTEDLNNKHPYIGIDTDHYGYTIYKNSYNVASHVLYYKAETSKEDGPLAAGFKVGFTTGYNKYLEKGPFLGNHLMLAFSQYLMLKYDKFNVNLVTITGESISSGIEYRF